MREKAGDPLPLFSRKRNNFGQVIKSVWTMPPGSAGTNFRYSIQDKFVDLKDAIAQITVAGRIVSDQANPYERETLYHGRTAKQMKDFVDFELRPLMEEMRDAGVTIEGFEEYLHNRHAEERNIQVASIGGMADGGSGILTADARRYLSSLEPNLRRTYEALAARVDSISKGTRDLLVRTGLEKQETIDAWERAYKAYVPLNRTEYEEIEGNSTGLGFSVRGPATKRAMGSTKEVGNILANLARQREATIQRAEKNRVAMSVFALFAQHPNTDIALPVDPGFWKRDANAAASDLIRLGIDPEDALNIAQEEKQRQIGADGMIQWRVNSALRNREDVLALRVNGEDHYVFFSPTNDRAQRLVRTLKNIDAPRMNAVMTAIGRGTRWLAQVNTQYNPVFGIYNFLRDSGSAAINLSSTPLAGKQAEVAKHVTSALAGVYSDLRAHRSGKVPSSKWAQLWEEFQKEGGQTGFRQLFLTPADRQADIRALFDPASWNESKWGKFFTANGKLKAPAEVVTKAGGAAFGWLSDYNEAFENAWRLAAYRVALEQGLSKQKAADLAKNLTVNFNRKGELATQMGALYAFFNAAVQGTDRLIQTIRGPAGKKILAGGLMLGVIQAALLAGAGMDEDEPPEFVKDRSFVVPIGDGKYVAVPMPLGLHVIPGTARRATEFVLGGFKDPAGAVLGLLELYLDAFNPLGGGGDIGRTVTPTVLDPVMDLLRNEDWTGKPIYREDISKLNPTPGFTRARDTATPWAQGAARLANAATGGTEFKPGVFSPSPDAIDYLIGQIFGGVGREASKIAQTATAAATGSDLPTYKIPLVGRLIGNANQPAAERSRYFDNLRELNMHEAEIRGLREAGRVEEAREYLRENPQARLISVANSVERDIRALEKRRRELIERGASRETIRLIEQKIAARMKQFNDRVKELEQTK